MSESDRITTLLQNWQSGDSAAREDLFALVYKELRRIAGGRLRNEMRPHTLQATEIVNEIYPKLAQQRAPWKNRGQFFAIASECMRRYLVDYARAKRRDKRGGDPVRVSLSDLKPTEICKIESDDEVLAVDRALDKLGELDETAATVVKYRYFGGMKRDEIAEILEVSPSTIDRTYRFAKAWLKRELTFEFSPYALNEGQITDKREFLERLRNGKGNKLSLHWRNALSERVLSVIDLDDGRENTGELLGQIVSEFNNLILGAMAQSIDEDISSAKTEIVSENEFPLTRQTLDRAFEGCVLRIT